MESFICLLVAALMVTCNAAFAPTVTFMCSSGPVYNVTLVDAAAGGVIFVENYCAQQDIASTTSVHIFNTTTCSDGGVPSLETDFYIVIQEFAAFSQDSDIRVKANCTADLDPQTQVVNVSSAGGTGFDEESTDSIAPTFSSSITDGSTAITSGTVGDSVNLVITIPDSFEATTFPFRVSSIDFSGTNVLTAGCSAYSFVTNPAVSAAGSLTISFTLVRPMTSSDLDLTTVTLSITVTLDICDGNCTAYTCSRRKRRSDEFESSTLTTRKTFATLLVYPPGQRPTESSIDTFMSDDVSIDDVCFSRTPMVAVLICLALALIVCVAISGWMYCKLRYAGPKKSNDGYPNSAYKP